ncbi:MAG: hypothetical protein COU08_00960 [Candidatus Harrisonbacteria bacterium CG10_big_fil_rev_8_21_14_0_10_42_17]|uniref:Uncharacterized protein n=1 Tax=Candidatus Harrisonbacteria bacterium CG10_big_fil_rev_8_21_14_0_10_42_17 TaxID=1974584 RepID=A0A2M6WIT9_9BACT|nr:MAG: hypothetical protein COU08_00960 [Candidatus Harrisonbacteria bacterium CG10_big_fil_rev_8_21_14_0_10_42_17]
MPQSIKRLPHRVDLSHAPDTPRVSVVEFILVGIITVASDAAELFVGMLSLIGIGFLFTPISYLLGIFVSLFTFFWIVFIKRAKWTRGPVVYLTGFLLELISAGYLPIRTISFLITVLLINRKSIPGVKQVSSAIETGKRGGGEQYENAA